MGSEIKVGVQLTYLNSLATASFSPGTINITQDVQGLHAPIVALTTAPTAIGFGSLSTPGIVVGRCLSATTSTGYILVGPTTSSTAGVAYYPFIKINGGEPFCFRLNSTLWKWKANAGTRKVQMYILED